MLLAALPALGVDSTPMEGIDLEAYDGILGHEKFRPIVAVALGRRDPKDENQPSITPKSRRTDVFLYRKSGQRIAGYTKVKMCATLQSE